MTQYSIGLRWNASSDGEHYVWRMDSGSELCARDANGNVTAEFVDPEEGFIASIASCQMLTFIAEAAKDGYTVDSYRDHPVGALGKDRNGKLYLAKLVLSPKATFAGDNQPDDDHVEKLHRRAQKKCYLSNSVLTDIELAPEV